MLVGVPPALILLRTIPKEASFLLAMGAHGYLPPFERRTQHVIRSRFVLHPHQIVTLVFGNFRHRIINDSLGGVLLVHVLSSYRKRKICGIVFGIMILLKAPFNLEPRDIWPKHGGENFGWVGEEIRFLVPDMGVPLHKYFIFYSCMNTYI